MIRGNFTNIILSATACLAVSAENPFGNALIPDMVADASVQQIGDRFYCYATTDGYGQGLKTSGPPVVWVSDNFVDWSFDGIYFPSASRQKYWAPSKVVNKDGKYYIYPTINGFMYPAVSDSPTGPFRLAKCNDEFELPYVKGATLIDGDRPDGIDAEVFMDDDGKPYIFWGRYHAARLKDDMVTLDSVIVLPTPHKEYSEGPAFFKRNGIYYYLYTLNGDERYRYAYMMSRVSPLGPWEYPDDNVIAQTDYSTGVYGPGHGCVFNPNGTDDYYFVFLEFSRRSTNRQTYVNKMEFNPDGTIKPVKVDLNGVGALSNKTVRRPLSPKSIKVSSTREPMYIAHNQDTLCQRTETFEPEFAFDRMNGSRWMPDLNDWAPWMIVDLGETKAVESSALYFVRPTATHRYKLATSLDGEKWTDVDVCDDGSIKSPHIDYLNRDLRYLKVTILEGEPGMWEWKIYEKDSNEYSPEWGGWSSFGYQLDGCYLNPVVPADFSDIDCIKVGDDYYAISSTFQFSPGMTMLHSRNLVDWEICSNIVDDLTQIGPALNWDAMNRYARGIWAGTLRYHGNKFYLFFGTPDEGFFMTSSPSPKGPWEPLTCLLSEPGWDDCTAIWDEGGKAWFAGTKFADGYKTYLCPMSEDGKSIDMSKRKLINLGNGREASKLIKVGDWYYMVFSEHKPGVGRYVMAKRTKDLDTGFENAEERQLAYACADSHEPNQGGIVEGEPGKWYFLTHHGTGDWGGREVSLLPVEWIDGWPVMGTADEKEIGSMQWRAEMPRLPKSVNKIVDSEYFDSTELSPYFQWNYQPRKDYYSLTERSGWLRLKAFRPIEKGNLLKAGNTLTQRIVRQAGCAVVKLDISNMADGQNSGLMHFSKQYAALGIMQDGVQRRLVYLTDNKEPIAGPVVDGACLWIKSEWDDDGISQFYYSTDGISYNPFGPKYKLSWGNYRGDRIGVYNFNDKSDCGFVDVDYLENNYRF